jgi:hypothetical protein
MDSTYPRTTQSPEKADGADHAKLTYAPSRNRTFNAYTVVQISDLTRRKALQQLLARIE